MSIQAESTWPRARRTLAISLAVLGAAALAMNDARASTNTVDFVTRIGQCNGTKVDVQGNNSDLQLQAGTTKFELWADFIENVNTISVHKDDNDSGTVTASIGTKRNGIQNGVRGCPGKGSVEVTVTSSKAITANLRRDLILKQSGSSDDYRQGINVKAVPQFDLTFKGTPVPACLANSASVQYLENFKTLQIHMPAGHLTDQSNCVGTNDLLITIPSPQPTVDVTDDFKYSLTTDVTQEALSATKGSKISPAGSLINIGTSFAPMQNPPVFATVSTASNLGLSAEGLNNQTVRLNLQMLALRQLAKHTKIRLTIAAPNDKASTVLLEVLPAAPPVSCGILSGAASPVPVDTGNLVDITAILAANAPGCAPRLTFKVTTASCFQLASGGPLPAIRGNPGVGVFAVPTGAGTAPGVTVVTLRATGTATACVGTNPPPTTANHRVDIYVGDFAADATVLDIPLGPNHIQVPLAIRKSQ